MAAGQPAGHGGLSQREVQKDSGVERDERIKPMLIQEGIQVLRDPKRKEVPSYESDHPVSVQAAATLTPW